MHLLAEQGVVCSVATNVLNPFTPFGDASLLPMANLYANVAQCGPERFQTCLDLVTSLPARLLRLGDYGIAPVIPPTGSFSMPRRQSRRWPRSRSASRATSEGV